MSGIRGRILPHSHRTGVVVMGEARQYVLPGYLTCAIGTLLLGVLVTSIHPWMVGSSNAYYNYIPLWRHTR